MANIKIDLDHRIIDGESVTFKAPCNCKDIDGLKIVYPVFNEDGYEKEIVSQVFTFKDTHGNDLTNVDNLFLTNSYVKVVLDATYSAAYIQNADTNKYLEDKLSAKQKAITYGTASPSGGTNGDIYLRYTS